MAIIYTTIKDVRASSGIEDEIGVKDSYIETKIEMAQGIIDGKVGDVYLVPFSGGNVPDMIQAICLNLTVSLLYIDQYGDETEGTGIDGRKMFDSTMSTLDLIWTQKVKLRDTAGAEYPRSTLRRPVGYPNASSTADGETCRAFTADKKF